MTLFMEKKPYMKTTIDLDLLRKAEQALGADSIKGTVDRSLRTVIEHRQLQNLADALGTIPLDLTTNRLRQQRRKRTGHGPR